MDPLMDIYANVEELSGKKKSLSKSSESIYKNVLIDTLEPNRTGPALSGVKKSSCRAAAVVLALLCLLLLTGLITSVYLLTKGDSERKTEMVLLLNSNTNLTEERDQLQTGYTNLIKVHDDLQRRLQELTRENNDLRGMNQGYGYYNGFRGFHRRP